MIDIYTFTVSFFFGFCFGMGYCNLRKARTINQLERRINELEENTTFERMLGID